MHKFLHCNVVMLYNVVFSPTVFKLTVHLQGMGSFLESKGTKTTFMIVIPQGMKFGEKLQTLGNNIFVCYDLIF